MEIGPFTHGEYRTFYNNTEENFDSLDQNSQQFSKLNLV